MITVFMLFAMAMQAQGPSRILAEEVVPGFLVADRLEFSGRAVAIGTSRDAVAAALGTFKEIQKPKRYTREALLREAELVERLAPGMPSAILMAHQLAERCGEVCWVEIVGKDLGRKDWVRISLVGPTKDGLRADFIYLDHDRALMRVWRSQSIADFREDARYFVTADGTWRVSHWGRTIRIEPVR